MTHGGPTMAKFVVRMTLPEQGITSVTERPQRAAAVRTAFKAKLSTCTGRSDRMTSWPL